MKAKVNRVEKLQRPEVILALVCLPVFIGALDLTIVSAVLPTVIAELEIPLQTGGDDAAWMVSGYLLAYTVSMAIMGRISDLIGRRRTYFLALLIFVLGSWLVAVGTFAPTVWMTRLFRMIQGGRPDSAYMALYALIAGRVVQALGAGAMVPVSMALVSELYPPARRATALGVVGAIDTAGWVLGHLYGGLMVQIVKWPMLFWINIPITTVVAFITWRQLEPIAIKRGEGGLARPARIAVYAGLGIINLLSIVAVIHAAFPVAFAVFAETVYDLGWLTLLLLLVMLVSIVLTLTNARRLEGSGSANWRGALLITIALLGLNIGLGGSGEGGTSSSLSSTSALPPYAFPVLAISAIVFVTYVYVERRSEHPLFNLNHFKNRNVSLASLSNLMVGFCLMVGLVSVPLFIALIADDLDQGALLSGLVLGTLTIPMALAGVPGGLLTDKFGYRIPTVLGLVLASVGFYFGRTWTLETSLTVMGVHMALAGIGLGMTEAPISTTVINAVRTGERGVASALVLIMRLLGMTFGTSIMTAFALRRTTVLTEQMSAALGTPPTPAQIVTITNESATMVINEMLLIAAIACAVTIIPALILRPHDQDA